MKVRLWISEVFFSIGYFLGSIEDWFIDEATSLCCLSPEEMEKETKSLDKIRAKEQK